MKGYVPIAFLFTLTLTLSFILTSCSTANSQNDNPTHLEAIDPSATEEALRNYIKAFEICDEYEIVGDFENQIKCLRVYTLTAPNYWSFSELARIYARNGEYLNAIEAQERSLELVEDAEQEFEAYRRIGGYYRIWGRYENAVESYQAALEVSSTSTAGVANTYIGLAETHRNLNKENDACHAFSKALEISQELSYEWGIQQAQNGLQSCP